LNYDNEANSWVSSKKRRKQKECQRGIQVYKYFGRKKNNLKKVNIKEQLMNGAFVKETDFNYYLRKICEANSR
jgi:hypothetical protein